MTEPLFQQESLDEGVAALRRDLLADGGPQISTMRNYNFAILLYRPNEEFKLRRLIQRMTDELRAEGWGVLPISLQKILLDRVRATGDANIEALTGRERRLFEKDPDRALWSTSGTRSARTSRGRTASPLTWRSSSGTLRTRTPIAPIGRSCSSGGPGRSTRSSGRPRC